MHGSWYDPSNPVVKYSGSLQTELFEGMLSDSKDADLVLVLGASLSGLNADRMASTPAARSASGGCLGFVIINLQQTPLDGEATLRINATTDVLMAALLNALGLPATPPPSPSADAFARLASRLLVPYDAAGSVLAKGNQQRRMWLNLNNGSEIKLTAGHNVRGANQPGMMHIGDEARGKVVGRDPATCSVCVEIEGVQMRLGLWWLEAPARGGPAKLPIVNVKPEFED